MILQAQGLSPPNKPVLLGGKRLPGPLDQGFVGAIYAVVEYPEPGELIKLFREQRESPLFDYR